ncbi:MAG: glycoside hydrolase family 13 protein [Bacteroidales bacterium]
MRRTSCLLAVLVSLWSAFLLSCEPPQESSETHEPQIKQTGANIPDWAQNVVWYQIFPERFHNADPSNDPVAGRVGDPHGWDPGAPDGWEVSSWTGDWYQRADWEQRVGPDFYDFVFTRRYGGDLQGVIEKLDYLQGLGVTAIYFNPLFDAVSLHKYDASHYHHVDRHLGPDPEGDREIMQQEDPNDPDTWQWTAADELFLELLDQARERNIRIIIDGVWNHTGRDFWAFRHIREHGEASPYSDWYKITRFDDSLDDGFEYDGWWGYLGLPEFAEEGEDIHPGVKQHIFDVTRRWMAPDGDVNRGVAGWRLDVLEELGRDFWRDWHSLVYEINPEALTVAEIWDDAARGFVGDDLFGVVMNYRWAYATHAFFIHRTLTASEFMDRLLDLLDDFPHEVNVSMQNLLDGHDTERLASMIVNNEHAYKEMSKIREIDNTYDVRAPDADERQVQRLIALFQYTWTGAPMVFYGTEAGLWGADDPGDRKPMLWPELEYDDEVNHPYSRSRPRDTVAFDGDLHAWYRELGHLRANQPALRTGEVTMAASDDDAGVFAFVRHTEDDLVVVMINRGEQPYDLEFSPREGSDEPLRLTDHFTGEIHMTENGMLRVGIPAVSGMILYPDQQ